MFLDEICVGFQSAVATLAKTVIRLRPGFAQEMFVGPRGFSRVTRRLSASRIVAGRLQGPAGGMSPQGSILCGHHASRAGTGPGGRWPAGWSHIRPRRALPVGFPHCRNCAPKKWIARLCPASRRWKLNRSDGKKVLGQLPRELRSRRKTTAVREGRKRPGTAATVNAEVSTLRQNSQRRVNLFRRPSSEMILRLPAFPGKR